MDTDVFAERMRNKSTGKKKRDPAGIRTQLIGVVVCSEIMADIFLSLSLSSHTVYRMLDPSEDPSQVVDFWGKSKVREANCSQHTRLS